MKIIVSSFWGHLQILRLLARPPVLFSRLYQLPWYRNMLHQSISTLVSPEAHFLEIGCAGGDFARELAQRGVRVWAVDQSEAMLARASRFVLSAQFAQADATDLPFPDRQFDVVFAASLLNVVDDPHRMLLEMCRVCRNAGHVQVLVPSQAFSTADARRYAAALQLRGFSRAAFLSWHRLAKKMEEGAVRKLFEQCNLVEIRSITLLGGLAVAVSGTIMKESAQQQRHLH